MSCQGTAAARRPDLQDVAKLAHVGGADVPTDAALAHDLDVVEILADVLHSGLAVGV